ncbi:MAG TPA: MFS transporter [Verrucomicrobiae bacterium]|jgi:multidrug resistance protein|nr:MFS transporter [Verrucomicrobiae bacterium]
MKRSPSIFVIFLTVFIDLVGFGIVVPMLPLYVRDFGAHGIVIGLIFSVYSIMQFIFSPIWGRFSDRIGRRPILLLSTAGACISYVIFALASGLPNRGAALTLIILSRILAGICGGNIAVAQAYVADITPPEKRSKMMGIIGMAIGLGFVFGPGIGAFSLSTIGLPGPGWIAAILSGCNFILAFFILAESRKPGSDQAKSRPHLDQWIHTLTKPKVGMLVIVFFLATFCFSCFEVTLSLLVSDNFHLEVVSAGKTAGYLIVFVGLMGALFQGGATGRLVKKFGEPKLILMSMILTGLAMMVVPFIQGPSILSWSVLFHPEGWPWVKLIIALCVLAIGSNLARPPIFGMISNLTPPQEQGATIGVAQGAGSLARILGPIFATGFYLVRALPHWMAAPLESIGNVIYRPGVLPYVACGVIAILTGILAIQRLGRSSVETTQPAETNAAH